MPSVTMINTSLKLLNMNNVVCRFNLDRAALRLHPGHSKGFGCSGAAELTAAINMHHNEEQTEHFIK